MLMNRTHGRIFGALAAVLAAGVAGYSLQPTPRTVAALSARSSPAEIRTQVIRRTIHIVRHQGSGRGAGPHSAATGHAATHGSITTAAAGQRIKTGASRSHAVAAGGSAVAGAGTPVTTRTSASHVTSAAPAAAGGTGSSASAPVTTRTSASHASSGSSSGSKSASAPVTTRSSSGGGASGGGEKGDGGGDHGD